MAKKIQYLQGRYIPKNPQKYRGDINNIIYRSSYELQFMHFCDYSSVVLEWGSEEVIIPYLKPMLDGKKEVHKYVIDFWMKYYSSEYERYDSYWKKVEMDKLSDISAKNIQLIKDNKHPTITALRGDLNIPSNIVGEDGDFYISNISNDIFIKVPGKYKTDENGKKIKKIKTALIEIKPQNQVDPPKKQIRITEKYKERLMIYAINKAKWESAREYAKKNGMEFKIITEKWLKNAIK